MPFVATDGEGKRLRRLTEEHCKSAAGEASYFARGCHMTDHDDAK